MILGLPFAKAAADPAAARRPRWHAPKRLLDVGDMRLTSVTPGSIPRAAHRRLGAQAFDVLIGALIGMLGVACGGSAGRSLEEGPTQATLPVSPSVSSTSEAERPSDDGDGAPGAPAPAEESALVAAPSIPFLGPPPSAPAELPPLPTTELETSRPLGTLAPAEVVIPPGDCRFDFLGEWVRCENAGGQHVLETDATDLVSCMQRCLEEEACTAVTDYLWLGQPGLGCYLYLSTCDEPSLPVWGEEDAGRDFRRSCASSGDGGVHPPAAP